MIVSYFWYVIQWMNCSQKLVVRQSQLCHPLLYENVHQLTVYIYISPGSVYYTLSGWRAQVGCRTSACELEVFIWFYLDSQLNALIFTVLVHVNGNITRFSTSWDKGGCKCHSSDLENTFILSPSVWWLFRRLMLQLWRSSCKYQTSKCSNTSKSIS